MKLHFYACKVDTEMVRRILPTIPGSAAKSILQLKNPAEGLHKVQEVQV